MTVFRKKFGGLTVTEHLPMHNYMMSDDAIKYPLILIKLKSAYTYT